MTQPGNNVSWAAPDQTAAEPEQAQADPEHAQETAWVARTLAGEQEAFALLVERYTSSVYTHVYYRLHDAHEAQDAVQEIFQRAYLKLGTFDPQRRFRSWLLTIASNYCTDLHRRWNALRRRAQHVALNDVDFWLADHEANPEPQALAHEQRDVVQAAVQQLDNKYREVVVLFYWNDLSYQEISTVTGLPESTVKTRLRRARARLAELLAALAPNQADAQDSDARAGEKDQP